jgi:hypothetical protein
MRESMENKIKNGAYQTSTKEILGFTQMALEEVVEAAVSVAMFPINLTYQTAMILCNPEKALPFD